MIGSQCCSLLWHLEAHRCVNLVKHSVFKIIVKNKIKIKRIVTAGSSAFCRYKRQSIFRSVPPPMTLNLFREWLNNLKVRHIVRSFLTFHQSKSVFHIDINQSNTRKPIYLRDSYGDVVEVIFLVRGTYNSHLATAVNTLDSLSAQKPFYSFSS